MIPEGKTVEVRYKGTTHGNSAGFDMANRVSVRATVDSPRLWIPEEFVTVLPDPIEVGDIVRGRKRNSCEEHCGEVVGFDDLHLFFIHGVVIRHPDATLVCRRADRLDLKASK